MAIKQARMTPAIGETLVSVSGRQPTGRTTVAAPGRHGRLRRLVLAAVTASPLVVIVCWHRFGEPQRLDFGATEVPENASSRRLEVRTTAEPSVQVEAARQLLNEEREIESAADAILRKLENHVSKERVAELMTIRRTHGTGRLCDELEIWLRGLPSSNRPGDSIDKDLSEIRRRWNRLEHGIAGWSKTQRETQP